MPSHRTLYNRTLSVGSSVGIQGITSDERGNFTKTTATKIETFRKKGRYRDGDGPFLNVTGAGTRSWVQRVAVHGRRRDIGLGGIRPFLRLRCDNDARTCRITGVAHEGWLEYQVPLSEQALAVLDQAYLLRDEFGLVFLSPLKRGRPLSNMTLTMILVPFPFEYDSRTEWRVSPLLSWADRGM